MKAELAPWGAGAGFLAAGMYACLFKSESAGAILLTVGVLLWLLANLDKLESFKGFGVEAKVARLRDATDEAKAVLTGLEEMKADIARLSRELEEQRAAAVDAQEELECKVAAIREELNNTSGMAALAITQGGLR